MKAETYDVSRFNNMYPMLDGQQWCLVVKSLDQLERRRRMLKALSAGPVMRITNRPVAEGLVVIGAFTAGKFSFEKTAVFREPRNIIRHPEFGFLLTEIDGITHIDDDLRFVARIKNPLFSFLHTLDLSKDGNRLLVCSTGFDAVLEIALADGSQHRVWSAWEHGFNPDADGVWLTLDGPTHTRRLAKGLRSVWIQPDKLKYDGLGLINRFRSAHPNFARYDPDSDAAFFVNIAFSGTLYRVDGQAGAPSPVYTLGPMSHGLNPYEQGWIITDTTVGRWYIMDRAFHVEKSIDICRVPGKPRDVGAREWLQQVVPIGPSQFLLIDSNRGLLAVDLDREAQYRYSINEHFCIQDALRLK